VRLQDSESHEEHEVIAVIVSPQNFPQAHDVVEWKFTLERDKHPTATNNQFQSTCASQDIPEAEEQIERIGLICD
jgi:hypothetical protein